MNGLVIDVEATCSVSPDRATSGGTAVDVGPRSVLSGGTVVGGDVGLAVVSGAVGASVSGTTVVGVGEDVGLVSSPSSSLQAASMATVAASTATAGVTRPNTCR